MAVVRDALGSILRGAATWMDRRRLPQTQGRLNLPGLSARVEVFRDRWGVPHIYASSARDLFFAQGFVHAQDRLWQMELHRRTATGSLSEVFGELSLGTDRAARTFGFGRLGRADWAHAAPEVREAMEAYSAGVNAYLDSPEARRQRPVEFSLLRHMPAPWKPEDSAAFSRLMIWQLSHSWDSEIVRARLVEAVGAERAAELEIQYPPANPLTLPAGIELNRLPEPGVHPAPHDPFLAQGMGSNAWVLAGRRTATGHPLLCNDMHLPVSLPCLWYLVHLVGGGMECTGVSIPGLPLVLVGHNARIAWGMTLAFTDCEDLFVERTDPADPSRYEFRGGWRQAEVVHEQIAVKGRAEPHVEPVVITHHGPVISDVVGYPAQRLAVQSMALQPCPALLGWYRLNQAQGWEEFVEAMRLIEAPQLNVAYADVEGNTGLWVTGGVPVRAKGQGMIPAPGWDGEHEWIGEVPFEEMPHALNPARGYVVTCNHRIVGDDYPHFLGTVWMTGYRAQRISGVLEGLSQVSAADCKALQSDVTCLPGPALVQRLAGLEATDALQKRALELLRAWDGRLEPASTGGAVYEVLRHTLVRNLLERELGTELSSRVMGQAFHPVLKTACEFYGHDTEALLRLLDRPDSEWTRRAGGREEWVRSSLQQAVEWLSERLGPEPGAWQWGRIHQVVFPHALALQPPLGLVFSRGPFPIGGDTDTPCQTAIAPGNPYDCRLWAPSFRQVVDLGDLSRSQVIIPPGQSGRLASHHYDDLAQPWLRGELIPMLWGREQVEREAEGRLTLEPAGNQRA